MTTIFSGKPLEYHQRPLDTCLVAGSPPHCHFLPNFFLKMAATNHQLVEEQEIGSRNVYRVTCICTIQTHNKIAP